MKINKLNRIACALIFVSLHLMGCQEKNVDYEFVAPAEVHHLEGSELSRLVLTQRAIERTDIKITTTRDTVLVAENGKEYPGVLVPYSAIIYDVTGRVWVYTNPEPGVFIRHEVKVEHIKGDQAYLREGPPDGTVVVKTGAAELYGTEYEVGH